MNDLALDPSETRARPAAPLRRPVGRLVLLGVLGLAGTGAFAGVASTVLSGFAGPQRVPVASRQKASDWPDLKDGLPALAVGSLPAAANVRAIASTDPAKTPATDGRAELAKPAAAVEPVAARATAPEPVAAPVVASVVRIPDKDEVKPDAPFVRTALPVPAVVDAPVIEPVQAAPVPPARPVAAVSPLPTETVRARTGAGTFAALPAEPAKSDLAGSEAAKPVAAKLSAAKPGVAKPGVAKPAVATLESTRIESARAKARADAAPKSGAAEKPVAQKPTARKSAPVVASATPVEAAAPDEDTEVFGIKVPSFAPAGRKIRESVEALGDAVKGLPERF